MLSREPSADPFLKKTRGTVWLQVLGCPLRALCTGAARGGPRGALSSCPHSPWACRVARGQGEGQSSYSAITWEGGSQRVSISNRPGVNAQPRSYASQNLSATCSVLSPRQQTSADPLSPPRSSSPAGALPQLSSVARTTHCSHHPFKHKRGRLLLVTLCHKKKCESVCM